MDGPWKNIRNIDEVIHSPVRLSIVFFLLPRPSSTYREIQKALDLTAGNLTTHLKKLEDHRIIDRRKEFVGEKPTTFVSLTPEGRTAVIRYSQQLHATLSEVLGKEI